MSDKGAKSQRYALAVFQALIEVADGSGRRVCGLEQDQDRYSRLMDGSRNGWKNAWKRWKAYCPPTPLEMVNLLKLMLQEGDMDLLPEVSAALGHAVSGGSSRCCRDHQRDGIVGCSQASPAASFDAAVWRELVFYFGVDASLMGGLRVRATG